MKKTITFLLTVFCTINLIFFPACSRQDSANSSSLQTASSDSSDKNGKEEVVPTFSFYEWGLYGENGIGLTDDIDRLCENEVVVGLLDSGIDSTHPDLQGAIYESKITLHRDFTVTDNKDGLPVDNPTDNYGHGTFVAGIICGRGDGVCGIRGVCKKVKIISLKVLSSNGTFETQKVINAIEYAKKIGIKILNFSAVSITSSREERDSFIKAMDGYDGLFICAAGNGGYDNDNHTQYPANLSYDDERIISVAGLGEDGKRGGNWNYGLSSNYGKDSVTIFAPGSNVLSAFSVNLDDKKEETPTGYTYLNGTSSATPFVTGVVATLLSIDSTIPYNDIKYILCTTAKKSDYLKDLCVASGSVDLKNAVKAVTKETI